MFELNNRFVFHHTLVVDIQSIVEILQLIHDIHTSGNKVKSSVFIFPVVSGRMAKWSERSASVRLREIKERV